MTAIYLLSIRQLTGKWRVVILAGLSALPLAIAAIAGAAADKPTPAELDDLLMNGLLASAILPIVVMAVATAALGNELSDKTLGNLTLTPLPHWRIALSKLAASISVSAPLLIVGTVGGVLLGFDLVGIDGAGKAAAAAAIAMAVGIALYSAVFLWAGLVTAHPLSIGLLYVFIWEGLFGTFVNGIKYLSIRQYTLGIVKTVDAARFAGPDQDVIGSAPAIVGSIVVFALFTVLVVRRLKRMDVP
jgi:ABC-2 type transport system permease protein